MERKEGKEGERDTACMLVVYRSINLYGYDIPISPFTHDLMDQPDLNSSRMTPKMERSRITDHIGIAGRCMWADAGSPPCLQVNPSPSAAVVVVPCEANWERVGDKVRRAASSGRRRRRRRKRRWYGWRLGSWMADIHILR